MATGNMFLTAYHRQLEEQAKKSKEAEAKKASAPKEDKPKAVKKTTKK